MIGLNAKIGLEIHTSLNTDTKLFCSCSVEEDTPNTNTCEICLGHPGSKPVVNESVLDQIILLAKAFDMNIREDVTFSRKTYFYPDLAKNYQITQFEEPVGKDGEIQTEEGEVGIRRIHVEEDPASILHEQKNTLIDYNRSGRPLIEIVTEPDISSSDQTQETMRKILSILRYLKIYTKDKSVFKTDINVSIRDRGYEKVEIKNVSGSDEVVKAVEHELKRQKSNDEVTMHTRGWDPEEEKTYKLREKESEADYGYIYEPDIPSIDIRHRKKRVDLPEMMEEKQKRYVNMGVEKTDADVISRDPDKAEAYEYVIQEIDPQTAANWFRGEISKALNYKNLSFRDTYLDGHTVLQTLKLYEQGDINDKTVEKIIRTLTEQDIEPKDYVEENDLKKIGDEEELENIVNDVISENPEPVQDYKDGEEKSLNYLVGQVMKKTRGKADPETAKTLLKNQIN